jgi:hypothetical protein
MKRYESRRSRAFLCYRRADAGGYVKLVYDALEERFPGRIFMDVLIGGTERWREKIAQELSSCSVFLVLIGPGGIFPDPDHADENDVFRGEIAAALRSDIPVLPVLLPGARLPRVDELPQDTQGILDRQARRINDDTYREDLDRIVQVASRFLDPIWRRVLEGAAATLLQPSMRVLTAFLGTVLVLFAIGGGFVVRTLIAPRLLGVMPIEAASLPANDRWIATSTRRKLLEAMSESSVDAISRRQLDPAVERHGELGAAEHLRLRYVVFFEMSKRAGRLQMSVEISSQSLASVVAEGLGLPTKWQVIKSIEAEGNPLDLVALQNSLFERTIGALNELLPTGQQVPVSRIREVIALRNPDDHKARLAALIGGAPVRGAGESEPGRGSWLYRWLGGVVGVALAAEVPAQEIGDESASENGIAIALERYADALEAKDLEQLALVMEMTGDLQDAYREYLYFVDDLEVSIEVGDVVIENGVARIFLLIVCASK